MSVANPVIDYIDPDASPRLIYLKAGVREYHPVTDIYAEVRDLRRNDETLRPYDIFVSAGGNVKKLADGSKRTPRYAIFNNTKVVPDITESHDLTVTGEQLFAPALGSEPIGTGAAAVDKTPLPVGIDVNVDYAPAEAEVIEVQVGSGLTIEQASQIVDLWRLNGLDPNEPVHIPAGTGTITAGDIEIAVTGDCDDGHTLTRQP